MDKSEIIQAFCTDILQYPGILSEEIMMNLTLSAGLVENDITHAGCDVLDWSARKTAEYIKMHIPVCSRSVLDDVYFLLIEIPGTEQ